MHSSALLDAPVIPASPKVSPSGALRVAILYSRRAALDVSERDDELIMLELGLAGLHAESVDLADISVSVGGRFHKTDPVTGERTVWELPHAVLMYHGALAPPNTGVLLDELERAGCVIVNGRGAWEVMTDKWRFHEMMMHAGVPTIPTRIVSDYSGALNVMREFGKPTVFKALIGTEGDDVHVVSDNEHLRSAVTDGLAERGGRMIAQPFIESRVDDSLEPEILAQIGNESMGMRNDIRVMTIIMPRRAPQIVAAFVRVACHADQVVNNVAKGSREVEIDFEWLHPTDRQTIWQAVTAMPDAQLVGWDLIGAPGERVIMEANSGAGLPIMRDEAAAHKVLGPCAELMRISAELAREKA